MLRYLDNMTSERVDAEGVKNVAAAAKQKIKAKVWHFCQSLSVIQACNFLTVSGAIPRSFGMLYSSSTVRQQSSSRLKNQ